MSPALISLYAVLPIVRPSIHDLWAEGDARLRRGRCSRRERSAQERRTRLPSSESRRKRTGAGLQACSSKCCRLKRLR